MQLCGYLMQLSLLVDIEGSCISAEAYLALVSWHLDVYLAKNVVITVCRYKVL